MSELRCWVYLFVGVVAVGTVIDYFDLSNTSWHTRMDMLAGAALGLAYHHWMNRKATP